MAEKENADIDIIWTESFAWVHTMSCYPFAGVEAVGQGGEEVELRLRHSKLQQRRLEVKLLFSSIFMVLFTSASFAIDLKKDTISTS